MKMSDFDFTDEYYSVLPIKEDFIFKPGDVVRPKSRREANRLMSEPYDLFLVVHCYYCPFNNRNRIIFRYFRDLSFVNGWACHYFEKVGEKNESAT